MDLLTANDRIGEYPRSNYAANTHPLPAFPQAKGAITCDVCVIGAGFTGLSAALRLAQKGYDVVLLDAQRVGFGASGRNGGQVAVGQRVGQDELEKMVGKDAAHALWKLSLESVALVRSLIAEHAIDCGWTPGILHADHRKRYVARSHAIIEKLQAEYEYKEISKVNQKEMFELVNTSAYFGGSLDMGSGHLQPLRYALGLAKAAAAKGVRIFERSRVSEILEGSPIRVKTAESDISAAHVILGCNGYLGKLHGKVAPCVMPINNFILATEPLPKDVAEKLIRHNYAVADSKFVVNYFRFSEDRWLLFGGSESYGYRFPKDIAAKVRKPMLEIFPQLKDTRIDYAWGGTLGITMNRMPHFARLAGNILSASGYSGQGLPWPHWAGNWPPKPSPARPSVLI